MVKLIAKIVGIVLLIIYLACAGFIYSVRQPSMRYKGVNICICDSADATFLSKSDVKEMIKQQHFKGKSVKDVNTLELSKKIESNPLIRKAYCYHTPDSTLRIDVYQRHPIVRVKSINGPDYYVDIEGEIMPVQRGIAVHLPLAMGHVTQELAKTGLKEFALYLADNEFWNNAITQIYVLPNGDVELTPRIGNHTILLGSFNDFEPRLENLKVFYEKVLPRKGWNAYKRINIKFSNQVIAEKAN